MFEKNETFILFKSDYICLASGIFPNYIYIYSAAKKEGQNRLSYSG